MISVELLITNFILLFNLKYTPSLSFKVQYIIRHSYTRIDIILIIIDFFSFKYLNTCQYISNLKNYDTSHFSQTRERFNTLLKKHKYSNTLQRYLAFYHHEV